MRRAILLALLLTLSGCLQAGNAGEEDGRGDDGDGRVLADYAECTLTGPDGNPVSCEPGPVLERKDSIPPGWLCLDRYAPDWPDGVMDVSLWTDGQGHFGQWLVSDTPAYPDMQFYSHVRFQDGGGWQTAPAFTNGFYPLGGTHPQDGRLAIIVHNLWDFQSSGSLDGSKVTWSLATQDLGVDGTPWNHLEVDADGTTYHFPLMSTGLSSGSWITADLWVQGTDFNATLKHGLKYGTDLDYSLPQGASLPGGNTACP